MEAAPRPPQDANGARQNSDNPESQPKDRKKSLDRKISFDAAIAEPESALGGATEAGGTSYALLSFFTTIIFSNIFFTFMI